MSHDPEGLRAYFNAFGEKEWERLGASLPGRIKFAVHRHILDRFLKPGLEVLDVGCGPGRFALHMAEAGAFVTLVDISDGQLAAARRELDEAKLTGQVRRYERRDAVSLSGFEDETYDLVVCYGSVLSYLRERHAEALKEFARVTKPGGLVMVSVTALYGTLRMVGPLDAAAAMTRIEEHLDWQGLLEGAGVVLTRIGSSEFHQPMALFSSRGLENALSDAGFELLELATSNPLVPEVVQLPEISANPKAAARLADLEVALCQVPGLVDAGEHLIAAARKPQCG